MTKRSAQQIASGRRPARISRIGRLTVAAEVLEAVKSVMDKLREKTGLTDDRNTLVDRALGGNPPMLAINALSSESERSEQKGFANLVRGTVSMFRNPAAHAPRIDWAMSKDDAEDLFSVLSLIHRRLDKTVMPPRV